MPAQSLAFLYLAVSKGPDSNAWVRGPSEAQTKTGFQLEPRFIQK